jgi:hypothetical protein
MSEQTKKTRQAHSDVIEDGEKWVAGDQSISRKQDSTNISTN